MEPEIKTENERKKQNAKMWYWIIGTIMVIALIWWWWAEAA